LPVVERFVLYDVDAAHFQAGKRPYRLIARDREGKQIAPVVLAQSVFGPKSGIWSSSEP
jgi:hypothetical protein